MADNNKSNNFIEQYSQILDALSIRKDKEKLIESFKKYDDATKYKLITTVNDDLQRLLTADIELVKFFKKRPLIRKEWIEVRNELGRLQGLILLRKTSANCEDLIKKILGAFKNKLALINEILTKDLAQNGGAYDMFGGSINNSQTNKNNEAEGQKTTNNSIIFETPIGTFNSNNSDQTNNSIIQSNSTNQELFEKIPNDPNTESNTESKMRVDNNNNVNEDINSKSQTRSNRNNSRVYNVFENINNNSNMGNIIGSVQPSSTINSNDDINNVKSQIKKYLTSMLSSLGINNDNVINKIFNEININTKTDLELIQSHYGNVEMLKNQDEQLMTNLNTITNENTKKQVYETLAELAKLQTLILIRKKPKDCDVLMTSLLSAFKDKISTVNNILVKNLEDEKPKEKIGEIMTRGTETSNFIGGNDNKFKQKYFKYKSKYLNLLKK